MKVLVCMPGEYIFTVGSLEYIYDMFNKNINLYRVIQGAQKYLLSRTLIQQWIKYSSRSP